MLRNYLAATLRNLVRNRLYAAINIVGLSVGLCAALLIALFVRDELSYDRFFPDFQRIYLVGSEITVANRPTERPDLIPSEIGRLLKNDFPVIGTVARISPDGSAVSHGEIESSQDIAWADPEIFEVFKFDIVAGNLNGALADPNSIVITQAVARKYFGRDDPIGETLEIQTEDYAGGGSNIAWTHGVYAVTAVIADLPSNTHLNINVLVSGRNAKSFLAHADTKVFGQDSWSRDTLTYVKFTNPATASGMQEALADFMRRHKSGVANLGSNLHAKLILRPIASLHLTPGPGLVWKPRGDMGMVYSIAAIGVLILVAAAINFVNLMTARSSRRAIEVGVRKTSGAERRDLVTQFLGESTLYVLIGLVGGLMLAARLLPRVNAFLDRTIEFSLLADIRFAIIAVAFVSFLGVLAGAYPALVLAAWRPAAVLRGSLRQKVPSRISQLLVALQFAVLIGLLIPIVVIYRQTEFAFKDAKQLDTDQVVVILGPSPCVPAFQEGLSTILGVRGVACTSATFVPFSNGRPARSANGTYTLVDQVSVSHEFFSFYGLQPAAGRFFSEDRPTDLMPTDLDAPVQGVVVLNETAVRALGFSSSQEAIGKSTSLNEKTGAPSEIIGVVPDYAFDAVHQAVRPTIYYTGRGRLITLSVRIDGRQAPETLAAIDRLWKQTGPPHPIIRQFLDQRIGQMYQDITNRGILFQTFAAASVAIAMLGLLGLAFATAEQRTKEIGIRKSMGATRADILRLLLWRFAQPVLWANLIAWPVAYLAMRRWLDAFAYRIELEPWMFLGASALALAIALLTVIGHALLVARARPVAALRYE